MTKLEAKKWIKDHGLTAENKRKAEMAFNKQMHAEKPDDRNTIAMQKWREKFCV